MDSIKLIKHEKKFIMYEILDPYLINNQFVDSIVWPDDISTLVLNFKKTFDGIYEAINNNLSGKYFSRLIYTVNKNHLKSSEISSCNRGICTYKFRNIKQLQELYLKTERKYFCNFWKKKLGYPWDVYFKGDYIRAIKINAEKHLPDSRVICLAKNSSPVALLPIKEAEYYDGEKIDWIIWIWIDSVLPKVERMEIRFKFVNWLRKNALKKIVTGVNPFNIPSNEFFEDIGFKTKCLQITRSKK